jgi:pimeloyl-ACP methyl ester carboxylesterase
MLVATSGAATAATPTVDGITGTNGAPVPHLEWGPCEGATGEETEALRAYECAVADVPLSYRDPTGQSIELALGRLPAADPERRLGTLFWNPGGPGGSGRIPPPFSDELHARFDIVGFDPRGIAASTPVRCFSSNEEAIELLGWEFPITLEQERRVVDLSRRATERCAENGGPLLEHMSTANVARDMDLLREAVGEDGMTYLGYSYGTHIGEVYANLFPDRVRALTLDSVIDPLEWTTGRRPGDEFIPSEFRNGSFFGSYAALQSFLAACAADERCAFREEGVDLRRKYYRLLERVRRRPLELVAPGGETHVVTYQTIVYLTLGALYNAANSPVLAETLQAYWTATERRAGRAGVRVRVRDRDVVYDAPRLPGRQDPADEPYLQFEGTSAVLCLDSPNPRNPWVWPRYARRADRLAPPFGSPWLWGSLPCATWPANDEDRYDGPWDRETANPVLLIGNRLGDPATAYEDAQSTERELADARLLTLDTFGHIAFRAGQSACVEEAVERYLIDLELPAAGAVCEPDRGPFDPIPEPVAGRAAPIEEALGLPALGAQRR